MTPTIAADGTASVAPARPGSDARTRRNPRWIALGVVAVCLGALAAFFVYGQATGTQSVVVVSHAVARGEVIERGDLTVSKVGATAGLQTVPADRLASLVGVRTAVDLSPGSLLPPAAIDHRPVPAPEHSVVGVRLPEGRAPLQHLTVGSPIRLVPVPAQGAAASSSSDPVEPSLAATVVSVSPGADGQSVVIEVDVVAADAGEVATLAAQDRLSVVRDAEG